MQIDPAWYLRLSAKTNIKAVQVSGPGIMQISASRFQECTQRQVNGEPTKNWITQHYRKIHFQWLLLLPVNRFIFYGPKFLFVAHWAFANI